MIVLLWADPAAAGDAVDLSGWSTTAADLRPDLEGETDVRLRQQVGVAASLPEGFRVEGDAAVRYPATGDEVVLDVHRLVVVSGRESSLRATAGRTVKLDARGLVPLDGIVLEGDLSPFVHGQVWGGRLWSPESLPVDTSFAGGGGFTFRPAGAGGAPSARTLLTASWMGIASPERFVHSVAGTGAVRGVKGGSASADVEVRTDPAHPARTRFGAQATAIAGKHLRITPEVRWEGLPPAGQVVALRTPVAWLAGEGYALGGGTATVGTGPFGVEIRGHGVLHLEDEEEASEGGYGRIGVGYRPSAGGRIGVFGMGAAVGASWVGGGGIEAGWRAEAFRLDADAALFQFRAIAEPPAPVAEVRLRGGTAMSGGASGNGVALSVEVAAGSDRLLEQWMRGGLTLEGAFGGGRNSP